MHNLIINGDFFNWSRGNHINSSRPVHRGTNNSLTADRWLVAFDPPASGDTVADINYKDGIPGFHAGCVVAAIAGTGSGSAFTAASGLTFDGNEANEANMAGASAAFAAAQSGLSVGFTGTSSQPAGCALALSPA